MTQRTPEIEFIGITATQRVDTATQATNGTFGMATHTEVGVPVGPQVNKEFAAELARAHEASGFDRVLIAHSSASIDGFVLADQTLEATEKLKVLLAHRPGFWAPTIAARAYATLDAFHPGRVAMHVITGGDDADQQRDGDYLTKEERYRRTDDFLTVLRKEWESEQPFDHEGEFYKVTGAYASVRPALGSIPIYFGGASEDAIRVGGKHADAYAFWGEPLDGIRQRIAEVRAAAAPYGRNPRFSVSLRPIVAETEEEAWARAEAVLAAAQARVEANGGGVSAFAKNSVGSQRLAAAAESQDVHDKRLWTALAKVTGGAGNSTSLVGTYEQVADGLLDYVDLGVTTLLIRGFDPLEDAKSYGRVIDLVRAGVKDRRPALAG
ncbi:LLM class flavin-dependent oxidoreductase [uncultured Nocardioides sp.]|uniref:LLM class flavin-dependent oxidoreductase n=1 Tax=uncultured Nocardioides sp. TaxID=198441 RepID=UPI002621EF0E|nr:LLM class flavin-dependent oxidoreductase [uncultured Nocardioides sp.]